MSDANVLLPLEESSGVCFLVLLWGFFLFLFCVSVINSLCNLLV